MLAGELLINIAKETISRMFDRVLNTPVSALIVDDLLSRIFLLYLHWACLSLQLQAVKPLHYNFRLPK